MSQVPILTGSRTAFGTRLKRATIEDRRSRLRDAAFELTHQHAWIVYHVLEHTGPYPALGLLIDPVPRRQIVGHEAPLYTCAHNVAQTVVRILAWAHLLSSALGRV